MRTLQSAGNAPVQIGKELKIVSKVMVPYVVAIHRRHVLGCRE